MDVARYVKEVMLPLEAGMPEGGRPVIEKLEGIEAIVFDIYGTLMISAAGDISLSDRLSSVVAMERVRAAFNTELSGSDATILAECYHEQLEEHLNVRRNEGIEYPEVEIRGIWKDVLAKVGVGVVDDSTLEEIAVIYECAVNPVWLMPGVLALLKAIRSAGIPMGIVSNAQFYTRPIFEVLLESTLEALGFRPNWQIYSFLEREAKPSVRLYEKALDQISSAGIAADRVFYLGNDFRKDVLPAQAVGFRAGLFAGDKRSLRLGDYSFSQAAKKADVVVTELAQVKQVFSIK